MARKKGKLSPGKLVLVWIFQEKPQITEKIKAPHSFFKINTRAFE